MLDSTAVKAAIDNIVTLSNTLTTLKAAPTVSTYGATYDAFDALRTDMDALNVAIEEFRSAAQATVRLD